jgi:multidrug efflux system outer membrane protein
MRGRATAVLVALLAGCAVGPDYHRPDVAVPEKYQYQLNDVAETANTQWWKQFDDPVLDQLIADALAGNKDVMIAAANVEQAAGVFTTVRSPLFPQIGYQGDAARQRLPDQLVTPGMENPDSSYQAFATASWEIDLWGRIRRQTESARANLLATQEARRGVLLSLVSSVATTYLNLRAFDEQLVIAQRTRDAYAESVRLFELQFKYGVVSEMTVEQARSQYETAVASIAQIEQRVVLTENALSILLGRNPGPIPRGKPIAEFVMPAVPAGLPSQLLERRPDIAQAEQNLIGANAQIGAAKALYFPTISLTGLFGGASTDLSDLFKGESKTWNYAGSITGPIFTGGGISGRVAQARASQKAALYNYEATIQNAFADVDNALSARQKLADEVAADQRLVESLRGYARLALLQYNGGYTSYLTVLDAEQQLFPAELELARARAALLNSATGIYKATGGGWIDEANQLAPQPVDGGWLSPSVADRPAAPQ